MGKVVAGSNPRHAMVILALDSDVMQAWRVTTVKTFMMGSPFNKTPVIAFDPASRFGGEQ